MPPDIVKSRSVAVPATADTDLGVILSAGAAAIVKVAVAVFPVKSRTVRVTDPVGVPAGTVAVNVPSAAINDSVIARLFDVTVYGATPPKIVKGTIPPVAPTTETVLG